MPSILDAGVLSGLACSAPPGHVTFMDLWDPYGGTDEEYGKVADLIWLALSGIAQRLLAEEGGD